MKLPRCSPPGVARGLSAACPTAAGRGPTQAHQFTSGWCRSAPGSFLVVLQRRVVLPVCKLLRQQRDVLHAVSGHVSSAAIPRTARRSGEQGSVNAVRRRWQLLTSTRTCRPVGTWHLTSRGTLNSPAARMPAILLCTWAYREGVAPGKGCSDTVTASWYDTTKFPTCRLASSASMPSRSCHASHL